MSYSTHDIKAWLAREIMKADFPYEWHLYLIDAVKELEAEIAEHKFYATLAKYTPTTYDWPPKEE